MEIAYIRVSTEEQNEAYQVEAMKAFPIEKFFIEKISAKDAHRPKLQEMMDFVREGDVVHIQDFSRLARSLKDLLEIVEQFDNKGVALISNKERIDSSTASGKLMLSMLGAIYEFERSNMLERQREGIALAKRNHIYKGRKAITLNKFPEFGEIYQVYKARGLTKTAFAAKLGISRPTLDRLITEYEEKAGENGA